jgi:cytochrome c6
MRLRMAACLSMFACASWVQAVDTAPTPATLGKRLFTKEAAPACAVCHTLKDAGTQGIVGPVLDEIKPDAQRVANAVRNGIGLMPSYQNSLTDAQIQALAQYVSGVAGK